MNFTSVASGIGQLKDHLFCRLCIQIKELSSDHVKLK